MIFIMRFSTNLFLDEKSNKLLHKRKLLPFSKRKIYRLPLFCVYFPENGHRMEFTEIKNLNYPYFHHHRPIVAGFASSESGAIAILRTIIEDTYKTDTNLNYRDYVLRSGNTVENFSEVISYTIVPPMKEDEEDDFSSESGKMP